MLIELIIILPPTYSAAQFDLPHMPTDWYASIASTAQRTRVLQHNSARTQGRATVQVCARPLTQCDRPVFLEGGDIVSLGQRPAKPELLGRCENGALLRKHCSHFFSVGCG